MGTIRDVLLLCLAPLFIVLWFSLAVIIHALPLIAAGVGIGGAIWVACLMLPFC